MVLQMVNITSCIGSEISQNELCSIVTHGTMLDKPR